MKTEQAKELAGLLIASLSPISKGLIPNSPTTVSYLAKQIMEDPKIEDDLKLFAKWIRSNLGE